MQYNFQNMINLLTSLNDKQKEAVTSTEGYIRVIAGAGSGKTKTLAHRYAYLVNEIGVNPSNILCVTFTNKAAQEMKSRVKQLVPIGNVGDFIATYHGFCVKVLREDIHKLSYPSSFIIMDTEDQKQVLREIYAELNLKHADAPYSKILKLISDFKHRNNYIGDYINVFDNEAKSKFAESNDGSEWKCIVRYLQKQQKGFFVDFDDIILFAFYILQNNNDMLVKWQNRLDYIMVDETQDNSNAQWGLVDMLQAKHNNLFVVGDPDQCIYEWRGAKPKDLLRFDETYKPCKTIMLNQNYRSTPNILDVANSIISKNIDRIPKDLFTHKEQITTVTHFHGKTELEEGEFVAQTIVMLSELGYKLSDVAILFRASYLSRFIEQALIKNNLTYVMYGGIRFFERKEIKDALSYLRMVDSADDLSFMRVINTPSRKLGKVFLSRLSEVAEQNSQTLYETLKANIDTKEFNRDSARQFIEMIETAKQEMKAKTISGILDYLLRESSLTSIYRQDGDEDRIENIKELISSIQLYEKENMNEPDLSLATYLQDISLYTNLDKNEGVESVKVMTIHQSKGLEFPIVFVIGMYEGVFPSHRTIRERKQNGLEEERRLAYVSFTRAEDMLFLTESEEWNFHSNNSKYPSRFIFEIKKNLIIREGFLSPELESDALKYISIIDYEMNEDGLELEVGTKIKHQLFGAGIVLEVNKEQDSILVQFDEGNRERHLSYNRISKTVELNND